LFKLFTFSLYSTDSLNKEYRHANYTAQLNPTMQAYSLNINQRNGVAYLNKKEKIDWFLYFCQTSRIQVTSRRPACDL